MIDAAITSIGVKWGREDAPRWKRIYKPIGKNFRHFGGVKSNYGLDGRIL